MKQNLPNPFFLFSIFIFLFSSAFAQLETNQWYFGLGVAVDFNSGSPVSVSGSVCNTSEGSASISDDQGNLLFYTDGVSVWNANNQLMPNGYGLMGSYTSSQSALIVPWPGSDSLYYVFTVDFQTAPGGLRYSIVDMSLQSGLGDVTVKNEPILSPCTEKVTAVCQALNNGYWIITHGWSSADFFSYSLTETGLDLTPVISTAGMAVFGNDWNTIGYLKASPYGNKIAQAIWGNNYFELFDFNDTTGEVSNDVYLDSYSGATSGAYGVEFSPDGNLLYGTVITPGYIYQWDLNAGNASAIAASKTLIGTSSIGFNGALQLANDGKIYLAQYGSNWLGAINDPNTLGLGCSFQEQGYQFSFGSNGLGLPNNFPCFYAPIPNGPNSALTVSDTNLCQKFCTDFFDQSTNNPTSWYWIFPGGIPSTSTSQNPTSICYQSPGVYDVTLITTNSNGSDTLVLPNYITVHATPPFPDITQSGYTLTSSSASSYQWQFNSVDLPGATNQSYDVIQTGYYSVIIRDENGCMTSGTVYILIDGINEMTLQPEVLVYPNPSQGFITIEFLSPGNETTGIDIVNTLGQIVWSSEEKTYLKAFLSKKIEIPLMNVSNGVYFIEIKSEDAAIVKKLIVSH